MQLLYLQNFWKLTLRNFCKATHTMFSVNNMIGDAIQVYQNSVRAVQPEELIRGSVKRKSNSIEIQGKEFVLDKNVYVVGFGKAVLGMAATLVNILQDHIISGILSIPSGSSNENLRHKMNSSMIEIYEGAQNNVPDDDSLLAANKISELISSLDKSSLLFVLISGGGSALLPSPQFPLTLEEKQKVIEVLFSKGAAIEEINVVRKKLSVLKGGGLAKLAKPAQVVSLILSDIIGDPIDLIASGPTIQNSDDPKLPLSIIEKYNMKYIIPQSAMQLLENNPTKDDSKESFEFVTNFVIGNNSVALNAAARKAAELQYKPIILTNKLCGLAANVGRKIIQLVEAALQEDRHTVIQTCKELNIKKGKGDMILDRIRELEANIGLCILLGGETTVKIKGDGKGGRNQELALAGSLELNHRKLYDNVVMLSAGTDGIDGPTDAAGAIATSSVVDFANGEGLDAQSFLDNNNSYVFYNSVCNGSWHVKIGHTGTNVMDVIIVLIKKC